MTTKSIQHCAHVRCSECGNARLFVADTPGGVWKEIERWGWSTERKVDDQSRVIGKCFHHTLNPKSEEDDLPEYLKKVRDDRRKLPGLYQAIGSLGLAMSRCKYGSKTFKEYESKYDKMLGDAAMIESNITVALTLALEKLK